MLRLEVLLNVLRERRRRWGGARLQQFEIPAHFFELFLTGDLQLRNLALRLRVDIGALDIGMSVDSRLFKLRVELGDLRLLAGLCLPIAAAELLLDAGWLPHLAAHEPVETADPAFAQNFVQDGLFWHLLTYCAGVGGSLLIIGSAAGVVAMGLEKIEFGWYLRKITLLALAGYFAGMLVIFLEHLLLG